MKFRKLDDFIAQKQRKSGEHQELVKREQAALEEWQALKAEYEKVLVDSLAKGVDSTKELDEINEKIEKAKVTYERRKQERNMYSAITFKDEIKAEDIVKAWNTEFLPQFRDKKLEPVKQRLLAAKKELIDAVMEYFEVERQYNSERNATRSELSDKYYYQLKDLWSRTSKDNDKYFLTELDVRSYAKGQLPESYRQLEANDNE